MQTCLHARLHALQAIEALALSAAAESPDTSAAFARPYISPEEMMATVMLMHWPEVTREQYEQARSAVRWETDVPKGAKFHVAWFGDDGLRVLDLWDSRGDFEAFAQERLMPAVAKIGIQGQPEVMFAEAAAIFAPNV